MTTGERSGDGPRVTWLGSALLAPVLVAQGLRVALRTPRLPAADGPAHGTAARPGRQHDPAPPLRLVTVGDSTAAGCGAGSHGRAFCGRLATALARRRDRAVVWEVHGEIGATVRRVHDRLLPLVGPADVVAVLAGVNDVLFQRDPEVSGRDVRAILDGLAPRAGQLLVAGVPPMERFPALPDPLARVLGDRARRLNGIVAGLVRGYPNATFLDSRRLVAEGGPEMFARDRFHPSERGYAIWAEDACRALS